MWHIDLDGDLTRGDREVNDFTFQAATINGSGSQSANLVLTRALFRMGVPVAPKNIFPSNIEGLPTWYQIRLSPHRYQCRRGDPDVIVALNPATWVEDVAEVHPGGVVIHDSAYRVADSTIRDDLTYYPVPFAQLAKTKIQNEKLRKYLANMIYVGVVAAVLCIPMDKIEEALNSQFQSKPKAVPSNLDAIRLGWDYFHENLTKLDDFRVEPMHANQGLIMIDGNQAAAIGCIMGGVTVASWYPITPSSSLCEALIEFGGRFRTDPKTGRNRIAVVQAEDELSALGMALGAGWAGARSMTSTSGPGISLMAEFAGLGYYAEIPAVIFDIQRVGPSTGLPTRTMQGDVGFVYSLSHGDTKHLVLLPATPAECYEFAQQAFDLAERFQSPVFVLSDLDLGMNLWMSETLRYPAQGFDRGKVLSAEQLAALPEWGRYRDVEGDGIPFRTLPGNANERSGYFTRGSGHDEQARYTESAESYEKNMERLARKHDTARSWVPGPELDDHGLGSAIIAFGTTHHAVVEARDQLRAHQIGTDYLRIRALPLNQTLTDFVARHVRVYVVEQNRDGQMCDLIKVYLPGDLAGRLQSIRNFDGRPIAAAAIVNPILVEEAAASEAREAV